MTPSDTKLEPCKVCDGYGFYTGSGSVHGCCGNYLASGECCGNTVETQAQVQQQCEACGGTGSTPSPAKVRTEEELDKQALKLAQEITYSKYPEDVREQADQIINLAKAYKDGSK